MTNKSRAISGDMKKRLFRTRVFAACYRSAVIAGSCGISLQVCDITQGHVWGQLWLPREGFHHVRHTLLSSRSRVTVTWLCWICNLIKYTLPDLYSHHLQSRGRGAIDINVKHSNMAGCTPTGRLLLLPLLLLGIAIVFILIKITTLWTFENMKWHKKIIKDLVDQLIV